MAHMKKYTRAAVNNIIGHNERTHPFGQKENIDPERSYLNQVYRPKEAEGYTPKEYYDKRMSEIKCLNRQNVNTLCSWVITKPEGVDNADKFFKAAFKFMGKRYGFKNVVAGYVHFDETSPHMHFYFIPVKDERVCAKEVVNRYDLQTFHKDLDDYMEREFGFNVGVVNGALKDRKNEDLETFKREEDKRTAAALRAEIEGLEQTKRLLETDLQVKYNKIRKAQQRLEDQKAMMRKNKALSEQLETKLDNLNYSIHEKDFNHAKEYMERLTFQDGSTVYEGYQKHLKELEKELEISYESKDEPSWDDDEWEL